MLWCQVGLDLAEVDGAVVGSLSVSVAKVLVRAIVSPSKFQVGGAFDAVGGVRPNGGVVGGTF